jgi:hypothetical protein
MKIWLLSQIRRCDGAIAVLVAAIALTFGVPVLLGLSWLPVPHGPNRDFFAAYVGALKFLYAYDEFSFPHFDWPSRFVERESLAGGEFPFWNPYSSLGTPLISQYQNQLLFPLEWLEIWLGPFGLNVILLLKIGFAGWGTYLFVSRIIPPGAARVTAALMYALSPFFLWLHSVPAFVNGAALTPWLFLFGYAIFERPTGNLLAAGALALASGGLWLTGQPQIAALSHLGCGIMVLLLVVCNRALGAFRQSAMFAAAIVAGLLIAVPQIAVFGEAVRYGYSLHSAGAYGTGGTAPLNFLLVLWPYAFGQITDFWDRSLWPEKVNGEAFPLLLGGSGLLLCLIALAALVPSRWRFSGGAGVRPRGAIACAGVAFLFLSVIALGSFGVPVWNVDGLSRINLPRYSSPVLSLCVAVLVAWGAFRFESLTRRGAVAVAIATAVVVGAGAFVLWQRVFDAGHAIDTAYAAKSIQLSAVPFFGALAAIAGIAWAGLRARGSAAIQWGIVVCIFVEFASYLRYGLDLHSEQYRALGACLGFGAAVLLAASISRFAAALALLALALPPLVLATADDRMMAIHDPFGYIAPHVEFLKRQLGPGSAGGRVIATNGAMVPNVGNAFGIAELCSLTTMQIGTTADFIFELLSTGKISYTTPNAWPGLADGGFYPSWQDYLSRRAFYNLLGVRYVIDKVDGIVSRVEAPGIVKVFTQGKTVVYEDKLAFPRAFVIDAVDHVSDPAEARKRMIEPGYDLRRRLPVEPQRRPLPQSMQRAEAGELRPAQISALSATRVRIETNNSAPGFLVLADAFYPGWTAMVNGKSVNVYRVAGALRGVAIPTGKSVVEFAYWPRGFTLLLVACGVGIVLALVMIFAGWLQARASARDTGQSPK